MAPPNRIVKETGDTIVAVWNGRVEVLPKTPYIRLFFDLQKAGESTINVGQFTASIGDFGEAVQIYSGERLVLTTSKPQVIQRILERNAEALTPAIALAKQWEVLCDFVELLGLEARPTEIEGLRGFVVSDRFFVSDEGDSKFYTNGRLSHLCIVPKPSSNPRKGVCFKVLGVDVTLSVKSVLCLSKMLYILNRRELGDQVFWGQVTSRLGEQTPQRLNTLG